MSILLVINYTFKIYMIEWICAELAELFSSSYQASIPVGGVHCHSNGPLITLMISPVSWSDNGIQSSGEMPALSNLQCNVDLEIPRISGVLVQLK